MRVVTTLHVKKMTKRKKRDLKSYLLLLKREQ